MLNYMVYGLIMELSGTVGATFLAAWTAGVNLPVIGAGTY